MVLETFWQEYHSYKESGSRERKSISLGAGAAELYFAMGTVRASFKGHGELDLEDPDTQQSLRGLVEQHKLSSDFRDDSYVLSDGRGAYMGRVKSYEVLFTPAAFEGRNEVLEDIVAFFSRAVKVGQPPTA